MNYKKALHAIVLIFITCMIYPATLFVTPLEKPFTHPITNQSPLLVIVLMVKDEAAVIRETLEPFVLAGIQHYLIFDTGSTDKTIEITQQYFAEKKSCTALSSKKLL